MRIKAIFTFFIFSLFLNISTLNVFAADQISPTTNISNGIITTKNQEIVLEYGYDVSIGEGTIQLLEDSVSVDITPTVDNTKIRIVKNTDFLPHKEYNLVVQNIDSVDPEYTFNDLNTTFKYSSLKRFELGYRSVEGRRIYGYSLGEGSQVYLFIGGIHGNEKNTASLVNLLLRNFDLNHNLIPSDTKLVFVPTLNVDGYRRGNRLNAHRVDLNRNSNTKDWRSTTYWGYTRLLKGGGTNPNSEPETRAIQLLIKQFKPFMIISYHSSGGIVLTNGSAARSITKTYAIKAKYKYVDQSSGGVGFEYKITGDLTTWMYEKGYKAMTVELKSKEYSEISSNLNAVKYMINTN